MATAPPIACSRITSKIKQRVIIIAEHDVRWSLQKNLHSNRVNKFQAHMCVHLKVGFGAWSAPPMVDVTAWLPEMRLLSNTIESPDTTVSPAKQ
jgi:hypothetical protein